MAQEKIQIDVALVNKFDFGQQRNRFNIENEKEEICKTSSKISKIECNL